MRPAKAGRIQQMNLAASCTGSTGSCGTGRGRASRRLGAGGRTSRAACILGLRATTGNYDSNNANRD